VDDPTVYSDQINHLYDILEKYESVYVFYTFAFL
jgi:hypothetical protein